MVCPICNSPSIQINTFQEQKSSKTVTKTKSKYKENGHGILWWLCVGWWWWIIDLISWFAFFFPRLILRIFAAPYKKKKYASRSKTVSKTDNKIQYKTICVCQNCGHKWST